jgi:hypothetical protein
LGEWRVRVWKERKKGSLKGRGRKKEIEREVQKSEKLILEDNAFKKNIDGISIGFPVASA